MMKTQLFNSRPKVVGYVRSAIRDAVEIASEPMVFSASPDFTLKQGGPITQAVLPEFMKSISTPSRDADCPHLVIDTRVHMLMPHMYPAIPGWHCDFTPRDESGQPVPGSARELQMNYAVFLPSVPSLSCTEFVDARVKLDYHPDHVWGSINGAIERLSLPEGQKGGTWRANDGEVIAFSGQTLHRATPANNSGWRFFLRASYRSERPLNQIRRQTQVYMLSATGW